VSSSPLILSTSLPNPMRHLEIIDKHPRQRNKQLLRICTRTYRPTTLSIAQHFPCLTPRKLTSHLSPHSLAVAKGCQPKSPLHLTDQALMLPLMQRNTALNDLEDIVKPSVYDWGQPTPTALPAHPDVILAADCCYFEPAFPLLLRTLRDLIGERTVCYFACVKRRNADAQFMKAARKVFEIEVVDDDPYVEEYRGKNVFLWVISNFGAAAWTFN
jgi:hypothetical protein